MRMLRRLEREWRIVAKTVSFAVFGAGSLLIAAVVFPLCDLWPGTRKRKVDRIRTAIHHSFRFFIWFMETLRVVDVRFTGLERLRTGGPYLIIANHPTLIDVVALISRLPPVDCVVKKEHWNNFFTRGVVSGADYIPNDGGAGIVTEAISRLGQGHSLLLFPEGTRSPSGGLGEFSRGFAQIAVRSDCAVVPVTIRCDPPMLMKNEKFLSVPARRSQWVISVDEPIAVASHYDAADSKAVAARKLSAAVRRYYEKRLKG